MKTAKEVAEDIVHKIVLLSKGFVPAGTTQEITQALTVYAKERVKEAIDKSYKGGRIWKDYIEQAVEDRVKEVQEREKPILKELWDQGYKATRAEALEEAAKIVHRRWERLKLSPTILQVELLQVEQIEDDIRTLKDVL